MMWKKLQLKSSSLVVLNAPVIFKSYMKELDKSHAVHTSLASGVDFVLAFVTSQDQLPSITSFISKEIPEDPIVWFAYPKKSSKLAKDISRDHGFAAVGEIGFEPVSSVSIDEDWSALRFRRVEYIKTMTRNIAGAITAAGKEKTTGNCKKRAAPEEVSEPPTAAKKPAAKSIKREAEPVDPSPKKRRVGGRASTD